MKHAIHVVVWLLVLVGGFWLGVEWGNWVQSSAKSSTDLPLGETSASTQIVPIIVQAPENTPASETLPKQAEKPLPPKPEEPKPASTVEPSKSPTTVVTTLDPNLPPKASEKLTRYTSSRYHYAFDVPVNVYFSAFPAEGGAVHTVGIAKEDPDTLADAAIRVYYYGTDIPPELQKSGGSRLVDPNKSYIYLLLDGKYAVKIEAINIDHPVVQTIINSISSY